MRILSTGLVYRISKGEMNMKAVILNIFIETDELSRKLSVFRKLLVLVFLLLACSTFVIAQPRCQRTVRGGGGSIAIQRGQVVCFVGDNTYRGSVAVNPGGVAVICGTRFYGSVANYGTVYVGRGIRVYGSIHNIGGNRRSGNCAPACRAPGAPRANAARNVSCRRFTANWNSVRDAQRYYLDVYDATARRYVVRNRNMGTGRSLNINTVPGRTYWYQVRAWGCNRTSRNSSRITVRVPGVQRPTTSSAINLTCRSFTARWNRVAGLRYYLLDVSRNSNFTSLVHRNLNVGTATSRIISGLNASTNYWYRVRAVTTCGTSTYSNVTRATTSVPSPSTPVAIAASSINCTAFTARWNAAARASGYRLDVSRNSSFTSLVVNNLNVGNTTSRNITGLTAGTNYYYRVRANNACGTSGSSGTITVRTLRPRTVSGPSRRPTLCVNTALPSITHNTANVTGIAARAGLPAGVTASYASNRITISGTPTQSGRFNYTITPNGCGTATATGTIVVNALPNVTLSLGQDQACITAGAFNLTGGTPFGGTYSGNGVGASPQFNPGSATNGTHTITYRYTDGNGCSRSATDNLVVSPPTVGGSMSAGVNACYNNNSGTLRLTGSTGRVVRWERSTNNWTSTTPIANTTATQNYNNLTSTTKYRAVVKSGGCSVTRSSEVTVNVFANLTAGRIGSSHTVSHGSTPSTLVPIIPASGGGGFSYQWQSSMDSVNFTNINGATNSTYSPGAMVQHMWYRRVVTSTNAPSCGTRYSDKIKLSSVLAVCPGDPLKTMIEWAGPTGGTGTYNYQWQKSTDGVSFTDIAGATTPTYSPPNALVGASALYLRRCVRSGPCYECGMPTKAASKGSPGGVDNPVVWLKADKGVKSAVWEDQSGNANHYVMAPNSRVRNVLNGDTTSNFNPFVEITDGGFDAPAGAALGEGYTIFMVAKRLASDNVGRIFEGHSGDFCWGYHGNYQSALKTGIAPNKLTELPAKSHGGTHIRMQAFRRESNGQLTHVVNGRVLATYPSSASARGIRVDINTGAKSSTQSSHSQIYELIIYNRAISLTELKKVQSYLMTKYRTGKRQQSFLSSTGLTTYDINVTNTEDKLYNRDVIGLAKECFIEQRQAKTTNEEIKITVSNNGVISDLKSTNADNTQRISTDVSYLMIGHEGSELKSSQATKADIPLPGAVTIHDRIAREWRITNTNFTDNYAIKFEVIPTDLVADSLAIMIDDDGDFTSGASVYYNGDGSGVNISIGSVIVEGLGPAIIPPGSTKYLAIGSKAPTLALPVEWLSFTAIKDDGYNLISWATGMEINCKEYIIEKSEDGLEWSEIGTQAGKGNYNFVSNYSFKDYEQCKDLCYYRIRQVDLDGEEDLTKVVTLKEESKVVSGVSVFPNPVEQNLKVLVVSARDELVQLNIFSADGQEVYRAKVVCAEGQNEFNIEVSSLTSGIYILTVVDSNGERMGDARITKIK